MWFWVGISFLFLLTMVLDELALFPYSSYFDKDGNFWIRKYIVIKNKLDLKTVVRASLRLKNILNYPTNFIDLTTLDKTYSIRHAGIFSYKSNIKILNQIKTNYPLIDMNDVYLKKYMESENKRGVYMVNEHLSGYLLLTIMFFLFLFFLYKSLVSLF